MKAASTDLLRVVAGGVLLIAVLLYLDPFYTGYAEFRVNRDVGPPKYLLLAAAAAWLPIALLALAASPAPQRRQAWHAGWQGWPLALLALYIVAGSLYARFGLGIQASFLQFGLAPIGYVVGVLSFAALRDPLPLMRFYFGLLWLALLYVVPTIVVKRLEQGQAFHTEVFLIMPLLVHAGLTLRGRTWRAAAGALLLGTALVLHKNLGYLSLACSALVLWTTLRARGPRRWRPAPQRLLRQVVLLVLAGGAVAALAYLATHRERYVPSGNPEVRLEVYEKAYQRFLASPLVGDAFTGSVHTRLDRRLVLDSPDVTTHSDWLDVLSHGGLVGLALLIAAIVPPLVRAVRTLRRAPAPTPLGDALWVLVTMTVCGTIVSMFVSLFISLPLAFLYWLHIGWLVAGTAAVDGSAARPGRSASSGAARPSP